MIQTLIGVCVVVFLTTLTIIVLVSGLYMVDSHVWIEYENVDERLFIWIVI